MKYLASLKLHDIIIGDKLSLGVWLTSVEFWLEFFNEALLINRTM